MIPATAPGSPVISAWSAVSPWGMGRAAFTAGLTSGRSAVAPLDPDEWDVPFDGAALVPDFDVRTVLGRKGTRSMDRISGMAVSAVGRLLTDDSGERLGGVGERTGLALGTSMGSAQSMMDFTRDSLTSARPYLVDPARFPNTVMNCAAGQSAIWHRLRGPNATLAGGRATGLLSLRFALRLCGAGRAPAMLCGAVEEFSRARAWLEWHARRATAGTEEAASGGAPGDRVLGEGAAMWLLERPEDAAAHGRRTLATPLGLEFGFARDGGEVRPALAACVRRLLDGTGVDAGSVTAVAGSQPRGSCEGEAERAALQEVFEVRRPPDIGCPEAFGDTCAASAAFQITSVLALAGASTLDGPVLVTSAEPDGVVGAALLHLPGDGTAAG
ncbi:beta-ketoacyl synthase N-terminal-like domain-containing protein [Streptomyces sp. NBC_01187]|uniref:beta-ketoacyl synthase N-terminal-like domain-containing protein n=1 Tax=Streptomyces sp. NBC_01187 TaxID=2903766 RepID=UPI003863DF61|nr:3-oxoacyl-ACP synthase [Streptomyces sp. NBC_01187]